MTGQRRTLPNTASIATPDKQGRLVAPSADRNVAAIIAELAKVAPKTGSVLEIASGTGQHIVQFGKHFPNLKWQPTDVEPERLISIKSWIVETKANNVADPIYLDAAQHGWATKLGPFDMIVLTNLLHLITAPEAETIISEIANALAPNGVACIYGPFLRGDEFASDSDKDFHQSLSSHNPLIGYKSFQAVQSWQQNAGLEPVDPIDMPANNLMLIARKPSKA